MTPVLFTLLASAGVSTHSSANCTFVPNLDFNGADVAASVDLSMLPAADRQAKCCALCQVHPQCKAGVLAGRTHAPPWHCWLKGGAMSHPKENADVVSCWKPGNKPPPVPSPPPPAPSPPPQCYKSTLLKLDSKPVLSFVDGSSTYVQVFNPSWVEASAGTGGKSGLIIRTQNCSSKIGPTGQESPCVHCSGTGAKASVLTFSALQGSDNTTVSAPRFAPVTASSLVFGPHSDEDLRGTEDPRIALDPKTGICESDY